MTIPSNLDGKLAVYGDSQNVMQLVAPIGWSCQAGVGADGSSNENVYPPGQSAPTVNNGSQPYQGEAITGGQSSACSECTLGQACPLFSAAAQQYQTEYGQTCPFTPPAEEATHVYSANVIYFEDPPGVSGTGAPSGGPYPANGLMTYYTQAPSYEETCTLPDSEHSICTTILNQFLSQYGNE